MRRWNGFEFPPELFDLSSDRLETRNCAADPAFTTVKEYYANALHAVCDPLETDQRAKADQDILVAKYGGGEKAFAFGPFSATPVPTFKQSS